MFAILLIFAGVFTTTKQLKWYKSKAWPDSVRLN
jgi:hypothetical protein